jgi:hypothetical protein
LLYMKNNEDVAQLVKYLNTVSPFMKNKEILQCLKELENNK